MTNSRKSLTYLLIFIIGYFLGKIKLSQISCINYDSIKIIFEDNRIFVEVLYFLVAIILLPIAYIQYRNEKAKEKRGTVEYAHKLFRFYCEEILPKEKRFDPTYLKNLSIDSDQSGVQEFNDLLNKIDTFAAAFIHGIADLDSGKQMMGKTYCDQINSFDPVIQRISRGNYKEGFENLYKLWEEWKHQDA